MLALSKNPESSFLVGVKISHAEELEKIGAEKSATKTQSTGVPTAACGKQVYFSFPLLRVIFENPERREVFERTFQKFVLQDSSIHQKHPWKIGFSFSIGLRKLVAKFVQAANKLKIKITVVDAPEFKFRCALLDSLGGPSDKMFTVQVFDFIGEYIMDIRNESVPKIPFLLLCKSLYCLGKSVKS